MYKVLLMSWALLLLFALFKDLFDKRSTEEKRQRFLDSAQAIRESIIGDNDFLLAKILTVLAMLVIVLFYVLFIILSVPFFKSSIMFFVASLLIAYWLMMLYGVIVYLDFDCPERFLEYIDSIELLSKLVSFLMVFYLVYFLYVCLKS